MSELLQLVVFAPFLVLAAASDLTRLRIPNWVSLVAIGVFVATLPMAGLQEAGLRLTVAGVTFSIGFALWMLRMFGGGDVKLLSCFLLLVPSTDVLPFLQLFAVSLAIGLATVVGMRRSGAFAGRGWVSMQAEGQFPMGISIALAGIGLVILRLLA